MTTPCPYCEENPYLPLISEPLRDEIRRELHSIHPTPLKSFTPLIEKTQ